jgi:hypothetical protein
MVRYAVALGSILQNPISAEKKFVLKIWTQLYPKKTYVGM